jgi:hypothetical protein
MSRTKNQLDTVLITVSTTPPIKRYLEQLVPTGLYGKNIAEAAERLLARSIDQLLRDETLKKAK